MSYFRWYNWLFFNRKYAIKKLQYLKELSFANLPVANWTCGQSRVRTYVHLREQIYSLSPLTTRPSTQKCQKSEIYKLPISTGIAISNTEPKTGVEPATYWLQISCSTNWAISAFLNSFYLLQPATFPISIGMLYQLSYFGIYLLYPEMHRDLDFLPFVPQSKNLRPTELFRHLLKELLFSKIRQYFATLFFGKAKVREND